MGVLPAQLIPQLRPTPTHPARPTIKSFTVKLCIEPMAPHQTPSPLRGQVPSLVPTRGEGGGAPMSLSGKVVRELGQNYCLCPVGVRLEFCLVQDKI